MMMLGPATFVLAIMGCGEGNAACQQVAVAPTRYESRDACLAASDEALASADAPFPVLVADCRAANVRAASLNANEIVLPEPRAWFSPVRTASARR